MAKTVIHVNKHIIGSNNKHGKNDPAISIKSGKLNTYSNRVEIMDQKGNLVAEIVQADEACGIKPLRCGAKIYIVMKNGIAKTNEQRVSSKSLRLQRKHG